MAILLIGSTGNGKSTLGNFLIDPDPKKPEVFEVATDNKPFTQETKVVTARITAAPNAAAGDLTIIDTPGLNDSKPKDLQHMTYLIKSLNEVKQIRACIFVVKYGSKLDEQYKYTIQYYAKLLPTLFSSNVLVVMTHYATDERSVAMRKRQRINEEACRDNIKAEIVKSAGMTRSPILFAVDCQPFDDAEKLASSEMRQEILSYIFEQQAIKVEDLPVAKPRAIEEDDLQKVRGYEGKISGYKFRLQEVNKDAKEALEETEKMQKEIHTISNSMVNTRQRLAHLNSDEEVVSKSDSVDCGWKWFQWRHYHFHLESDTDISSVRKWKKRDNAWENYSEGRRSVSVRLQGEWFGGLAGEVTLYTRRKWIHEGEIDQLKSEISLKECDLRYAEKERQRSHDLHIKHKGVIEVLERYIEEINEDIRKISGNTMTLEEAERRIGELNSQDSET